jgi:hypothetical protein
MARADGGDWLAQKNATGSSGRASLQVMISWRSSSPSTKMTKVPCVWAASSGEPRKMNEPPPTCATSYRISSTNKYTSTAAEYPSNQSCPMPNPILEANAKQYAQLCRISLNLKTPLGYGNDGTVWRSSRQTAVKAYESTVKYDRELECYQRFARGKVRSIHGLAVPELIAYSHVLHVIEMRIVTPPFLLDFAKAHLDVKPDFPDEVIADWEQEGIENFGERWGDVKIILYELQRHGIYYYDAKPGNINFGDSSD